MWYVRRFFSPTALTSQLADHTIENFIAQGITREVIYGIQES